MIFFISKNGDIIYTILNDFIETWLYIYKIEDNNITTLKFNHIDSYDRDVIHDNIIEYFNESGFFKYNTNIINEISEINHQDSIRYVIFDNDIELLDRLIKLLFDEYDIQIIKNSVDNSIIGYYSIAYELINKMLWLEFEYMLI